MNNQDIFLVIFISALATFALRIFPFLLVGYRENQSKLLSFLGRILPPAIMAVLIVYCLKDIPVDICGIGIPKIIGVFITGVSYIWKKNTFVSMTLGTVIYMILIQMF